MCTSYLNFINYLKEVCCIPHFFIHTSVLIIISFTWNFCTFLPKVISVRSKVSVKLYSQWASVSSHQLSCTFFFFSQSTTELTPCIFLGVLYFYYPAYYFIFYLLHAHLKITVAAHITDYTLNQIQSFYLVNLFKSLIYEIK